MSLPRSKCSALFCRSAAFPCLGGEPRTLKRSSALLAYEPQWRKSRETAGVANVNSHWLLARPLTA